MKVKEAPKFDIGKAWRTSPNHPKIHDKFLILPAKGLFVVIDGLGSSDAPITAANKAKKLLVKSAAKIPDDVDTNPRELSAQLGSMILDVNDGVRATSGRATVGLIKLWENSEGDKIIYSGFGHDTANRLTGDRLSHLNMNDGLLDLVHAGELEDTEAWEAQRWLRRVSSIDEAPSWVRPLAGVYLEKVRYALGDPEDVVAAHLQSGVFDLIPGSTIALSTDGVTSKGVQDQTMVVDLRRLDLTNQQKAQQIISRTPNALGKGHDDKTLLIISKN